MLEDHRATLGATELRAHASAHGTALASLGVGLGLRRRRAREVLLWSERSRAAALVGQPTPPPDDSTLVDALADVRQLQANVRESMSQGEDPRSSVRALRAAERRATELSRRVGGSRAALSGLTFDAIDDLVDLLAERTLVEFVRAGTQLWAVTVAEGTAHLTDVGPLGLVDDLLNRLAFATRRALGPSASTPAERTSRRVSP